MRIFDPTFKLKFQSLKYLLSEINFDQLKIINKLLTVKHL